MSKVTKEVSDCCSAEVEKYLGNMDRGQECLKCHKPCSTKTIEVEVTMENVKSCVLCKYNMSGQGYCACCKDGNNFILDICKQVPIPEPKSEEVKSCDNCKHYSDINGCAIAKGVPCARTGKEGDKYGDGTWEFWNIDPQPFDYEKWKIERLAKLDKLYKHFLESRNIPYLTLRELFSSALDELNLKRGGK